MATPQVIPPPPPGFTLDAPPPPPEGFTLDAAQAEAKAAPTPAPKAETTTGEKIAGFPLTRAVMGSPLPEVARALFRTPGTPIGESGIDQAMAEYEKAKRKGMEYWHEKTGGITAPATAPDWAGIAGMIGPTALATKTLKAAPTALGRIWQDGKVGALTGLAEPVTGPKEDYVGKKAKQAGIGFLAGMGIPAGLELGATGLRFAKNVAQPLPEVANRLLTGYQREIIGEKNIPAVQQAIQNVERLVKGSPPTAAEAMVGTPAGSPLQAHQKMIAAAPGGPSERFGTLVTRKEAARKVAREAADGLMEQMKDKVIASANTKGGIPIPSIQAKLFDLSKQAGVRSTPLTQSLDATRAQLQQLAGKNLRVDARDMMTLRDATTVAPEIRAILDDAIDKAGKPGWKKYLEVYDRQVDRIAKDAERQAAMYSPPQPTQLGSMSKEESGLQELPHVLSHEIAIGNYVLGFLRRSLEPEINRLAAARYLDPKGKLLTALIEKPDIIEPEVWNALTQVGAVGGAAMTTQPHAQQARKAARELGVSP